MGTIDWTCQNLVFSFNVKEQLEGVRGVRVYFICNVSHFLCKRDNLNEVNL